MARSSPRKKVAVNYDESDIKPATDGIAHKALSKVKSAISKVTTKRKEPSEESSPAVNAAPVKPAKKRKTAKAKDEDAMPLADRTAVSFLKKGMYIGAHVSAAGGMFKPVNTRQPLDC